MNRQQRRTILSRMRKNALANNSTDAEAIAKSALAIALANAPAPGSDDPSFGNRVYEAIINMIDIPGLDEGLARVARELETLPDSSDLDKLSVNVDQDPISNEPAANDLTEQELKVAFRRDYLRKLGLLL